MSIDTRRDKESTMHLHSGAVVTLGKEIWFTTPWKSQEDIMLSDVSRAQSLGYLMSLNG